jgi:2-amino-4-hydroxy-6-hydroxymethyldihydropteridine diphosphokinase
MKLAIEKIKALKDTRIIKESKLFKSAPCGGPKGQPDYLNGALKIQTSIPALILLKELKKIETEIGRTGAVRFGPRVIDLDILLYGDKVISNPRLTVPHPRMFEREFVVKPLLEVL